MIGRPGSGRGADVSVDETRKWLFRFRDGQEAETVYIPDPVEDRGAVCISSQVGCTLSCRFCHTGTQTLVRNLGAPEIVGQFMAARDSYGEWPSPKGETPRLLSTIVLMGMGEPLYNYANVAKAMKIVMDGEGIGLSRRRITLSTSGVVPMMDRAGEELGVNLAVSLHAVRDDLRDDLVPLNRKYPISRGPRRLPALPGIIQRSADHIRVHHAEGRERLRGRGAGTGAADRRECRRKLISSRSIPGRGRGSRQAAKAALERFAAIVNAAGFASPIRTPRGQDILAACGQLRTESRRERA